MQKPDSIAKIFISYSNNDKERVNQYVEELRNRNYEILMDDTVANYSENFEEVLMEAQRSADGTIVFLTENGINSKQVTSEVGLARSYYDNSPNAKFLIPLVSRGIEVPYIIKDFEMLNLDENSVTDNVSKIDNAIKQFLTVNKTVDSKTSKQNFQSKAASKKSYPKTPAQKDLSSDEVKKIQTALKELGIFSSTIDGQYGRATENAVINFQEKYDLEKTGRIDEKTFENILKKAAQLNASKDKSSESITYWLLKINGVNWEAEELAEDSYAYFNSYQLGKKTNEYELFQQVKVGDQILAYDYEKYKAIVFIFEVTEALHLDNQLGEIINMRIDRVMNPPIILTSVANKIAFIEELKPSVNKKLFTLNPELYTEIISIKNTGQKPQDKRFNKSTISEIFTDSPSTEIKDQLEIESDINALASVIAYRKVEPPLAVGLFGNWGSGKSFFMNKLEAQINEFAKLKNDVYCQEVVHVKFNSWHYSDSNLWASLIMKIFEELQKYKKDDAGLKTLIQNLNSTKELIADSKIKLERVTQEKAELETRKTETEKGIKEQAKQLENLTLKDIAKEVWEDKSVQDNVSEIKKLLPGKLVDNYSEVKTMVNELSSFGNQIIESIRIIYGFRKGSKPLALLFAVIVFGLLCALVLMNRDGAIDFLNFLNVKFAVYVTALTQFVGFLLPAMGKVNTAYKNLKSLEDTYIKLEETKRKTHNEELQSLTNQLEIINAELKKQEEELSVLTKIEMQLNNEIDDIINGKKLNQFIEARSSDKRYIESLGIISWIRKDFEELNFLLKMQNELNDEKLKELGKDKVENIFKIDRIVLYIDDLDRCNQDIVVRVLEAIHLLLAFPLFVVVVGVDPRWMHNALSIKYKDFLRPNGRRKKNAELNPSVENNPILHPTSATSYDYLEKIFQVPFVLKPIDDDGKDKLIRSKFEEAKQFVDTTEKTIITNDSGTKNTDDIQKIETGEENVTIKNKISTDNATKKSTLNEAEYEKQKEKERAEHEKKILAQSEFLKISEDEIQFMQDISFIIGDTPRTINRYINIYRIIRTHSKFEFLDSNELEHYYAAMISLAVITGQPESAQHFFEKLNLQSDSTTFGDFVHSLVKEDKEKYDLLSSLMHQKNKEKFLKTIQNLKLDKFKKNFNLIKRFSFRDLA